MKPRVIDEEFHYVPRPRETKYWRGRKFIIRRNPFRDWCWGQLRSVRLEGTALGFTNLERYNK